MEQKIIVGDCMDELPRLADNSIDIIVTSPPYNIGIAYNSYQDNQPRESYLHWIGQVGAEMYRVMKPDASLFLNVGSTNVDPWIAADVAHVFRNRFLLQNHIIWAKSLSIDETTFGHFKPINSERFLNHTHEAIYHFTKHGRVSLDRLAVGVPFTDKTNIARRGHAQDKRCGGNIWFIPYQTVKSKTQKYNHPAGFPVDLAKRCIRLHGYSPETVVLDPFMGAGSTLVAASELGCGGVGIELDADYAATAKARLATFYSL